MGMKKRCEYSMKIIKNKAFVVLFSYVCSQFAGTAHMAERAARKQ